MLGRPPKVEAIKLDAAINRLLDGMDNEDLDSEQYSKNLEHLERLSKLRTQERPGRVDLDTMVAVAGNILGIVIIVAYEQKHVMTSKGLGFVRPHQPKVNS